MTSTFLDAVRSRVVIYDGATGTWLQEQGLTAEDFGGAEFEGCNEMLGVTRPDVIERFHRTYFELGVDVVETVLSYRDVQNADEIFSSGNYSKVMPVNRIDERSLQPGPLYRKARELYWDYAHA